MQFTSLNIGCESPLISQDLTKISISDQKIQSLQIIQCFRDSFNSKERLFQMHVIINPSSTNVHILLSRHILVIAPQLYLKISHITKMINEMSVNNKLNEFIASVQKSLHFQFHLKKGALSFLNNFLLRIPILSFDYHKFFEAQRKEEFSLPEKSNSY
jgi:hypothetical protein